MKSWHSHVDVGKKVLASALSAAMVVAFTPVVAMADENVATVDLNHDNVIGEGETFATLSAAIAAAKSGDTVSLLQDVSIGSQITIDSGRSITLDTRGKTITATPSTTFMISDGKFSVIGGGSINAQGEAFNLLGNNNVSTWQTVSTPAEVTIGKGVTVTSKTDCCVYYRGNGAVANIYGFLTSEGLYAPIQGHGNINNGDTVVNIFEGSSVTSTTSMPIYHPQIGEVNIYGGTITGETTAIEMRAGKLVISGGTLKSNATSFSCNPNGSGSTTEGAAIAIAQHTTKKDIEVTITGGSFEGVKALNESNPQNNDPAPQVTLQVKGGVFKGEVSVADTQKFITNGIFSVDPSSDYLVSGVHKLHKGTNGNHFAAAENLTASGSAATCTSAGYSSTYCAECGYVASSSTSPALGHSWGGAVVTTPATETSEGVATSTCGRCGATQTSSIAKLPAAGSDTTATDESGSKVDVTVTDNTPTTIPGTTSPAAGTVTYNGTEAAAGSAPTTTATVPSTVTIGGSTYVVTAIAEDAFKDEAALQSVTIPETVVTIGSSAFESCTALTSVTVPAGVTSIESSTFAGCTNLTTVEVKGELTEIAADAFNGCTNLTGLTTSGGIKPLAAASAATGKLVIPASVTKIGDRAFKGTGITSVTIPAGVKMGTGVFRDCKQLKSASVEKSVKTLSSYTFKGCTALKSVTVPSGVTKLERSVFNGCKNLTKVTLPKSVTSIGKYALYGASKAKTLTINSKKLTKSGVKGSLVGSKVTTVKVPKSMVSAYKKIFTAKNCGKTVKVRAI